MNLNRVAIIGAGTMGSGIAQWMCQSGLFVQITDLNLEFARIQLKKVHASWDKLESKGKFSAAQVKGFKNSLSVVGMEELNKDTDLVIEAIVEKREAKLQVFHQLDQIMKPDCILASNTSSIPIDSMARELSEGRRHNFLGLHFFNPAPVMKLVEIISGYWTDGAVAQNLAHWFESAGKRPALCKDAPGFIVNRVARNFYGEALRMAKVHNLDHISEIDTVLREVGGFRMGPFELMDLIGIDVNYSVTQSVWQSFYYEPRFAPHSLQRQMVESARLGKSPAEAFIMNKWTILATKNHPLYDKLKNVKANFYDLEKDEPFEKRSQYDEAHIVFDFALVKHKRKEKLLSYLQKETSAPLISDLSCYWGDFYFEKHSHLHGAVAGAFWGPTNKYEFAAKNPAAQDAIQELFTSMGLETIEVMTPGIGFTYPRVISMIINEAFFAMDEGLAEKKDIDTAMRFGVNYPLGPFEWAEKIGAKNIVQLLDTLRRVTGEPRYRVSPLLRLETAKG